MIQITGEHGSKGLLLMGEGLEGYTSVFWIMLPYSGGRMNMCTKY